MQSLKTTTARGIAKSSFILSLIAMASACVVETPRDGYWDRDNHRWYHDHAWHECVENDVHCH